MTVPSWPNTLPQYPLRDSYRVQSDDNHIVRTEMEDGAPVLRRRRLSLWTEVSLDFVLTFAQYDTLRDFYRLTLNAGTSRFTMPVYDFSGSLVTKTVLWKGGGPTPAKIGLDRIRASFSVSVLGFYN